jgi:dTDP-4-dehydrorhamnose 3,5-epimerase
MRYSSTNIDGVFVLGLEPLGDDRGFFARLFCAEEYAASGLEASFVQINNSLSTYAGTLRGLHYQVAPAGEVKLVRCVNGSVYDVVVDLRKSSPTFGQWFGEILSADNRLMMYVPKGCAHGFMTLEDRTEMIYAASASYLGKAERIVRWDDPRFDVQWPRKPSVISDKDRTALDYDLIYHASGY